MQSMIQRFSSFGFVRSAIIAGYILAVLLFSGLARAATAALNRFSDVSSSISVNAGASAKVILEVRPSSTPLQ
jgi:hypothetical protein